MAPLDAPQKAVLLLLCLSFCTILHVLKHLILETSGLGDSSFSLLYHIISAGGIGGAAVASYCYVSGETKLSPLINTGLNLVALWGTCHRDDHDHNLSSLTSHGLIADAQARSLNFKRFPLQSLEL
nr:hypothetical protein CFP56_13070 [Quercus suber]